MREIEVGLIRGRHEMPVDKYIFENPIEDVHDYAGMACEVIDYIFNNVEKNELTKLNIYVTGLTAAALAVFHVCFDPNVRGWNIRLNAKHYDVESGCYRTQPLISA